MRSTNKAVPSPSVAPPSVAPLLVDLRVAATILGGASLIAVRKLVRANKIRHVRIGKRWMVSPSELERFVSRELGRAA
jgi:excisionase family DNA binding protein